MEELPRTTCRGTTSNNKLCGLHMI
jgi:hypothetical protein